MAIRTGGQGKVKRQMDTKALKTQVEHDMYVVDTHLVAAALLRRAAVNRADQLAVNRRGARVRAAADRNPRPSA
jgi:hypothetical protein